MEQTADALEAGLDEIRRAPSDHGRLKLVVRRPAVDEREILQEARLDPAHGLVGDTWSERWTRTTPDGAPNPAMQLNVMSARVAALLAGEPERWALAGDQLYVDLDLSEDGLPAGSRLAIGSAVIEISEQPHRGCKKFAARFGLEALRFVNSPVGQALRLRGANARVITAGIVRPGDTIRRVDVTG